MSYPTNVTSFMYIIGCFSEYCKISQICFFEIFFVERNVVFGTYHHDMPSINALRQNKGSFLSWKICTFARVLHIFWVSNKTILSRKVFVGGEMAWADHVQQDFMYIHSELYLRLAKAVKPIWPIRFLLLVYPFYISFDFAILL